MFSAPRLNDNSITTTLTNWLLCVVCCIRFPSGRFGDWIQLCLQCFAASALSGEAFCSIRTFCSISFISAAFKCAPAFLQYYPATSKYYRIVLLRVTGGTGRVMKPSTIIICTCAYPDMIAGILKWPFTYVTYT